MTKSEKLAHELSVMSPLDFDEALIDEAAAHLRALQAAIESAPHADDCMTMSEPLTYPCDCFKAEFMSVVE